jgi:hypothetical protein
MKNIITNAKAATIAATITFLVKKPTAITAKTDSIERAIRFDL